MGPTDTSNCTIPFAPLYLPPGRGLPLLEPNGKPPWHHPQGLERNIPSLMGNFGIWMGSGSWLSSCSDLPTFHDKEVAKCVHQIFWGIYQEIPIRTWSEFHTTEVIIIDSVQGKWFSFIVTPGWKIVNNTFRCHLITHTYIHVECICHGNEIYISNGQYINFLSKYFSGCHIHVNSDWCV